MYMFILSFVRKPAPVSPISAPLKTIALLVKHTVRGSFKKFPEFFLFRITVGIQKFKQYFLQSTVLGQ